MAKPQAKAKPLNRRMVKILPGDASSAPLCDDYDRPVVARLCYIGHGHSRRRVWCNAARLPSLCSLLSARIVPPEGGNTEFATMRAAYDDLPPATKDRLEGLIAEHDMVYSRGTVDPTTLTPEMQAELPAVRQAMVRVNPVNGRKAVYVGAHASQVIGWPVEAGRAFIQELTEFATQSTYCYSHQWRGGEK